MSRYRVAVQINDVTAAQHVIERLEFVGETVIRIADIDVLPADVGGVFTDCPGTPIAGSVPMIRVVTDPNRSSDDRHTIARLDLPLQLNELMTALHAAAQFRDQQGFARPPIEKETLKFGDLVGRSRAEADPYNRACFKICKDCSCRRSSNGWSW